MTPSLGNFLLSLLAGSVVLIAIGTAVSIASVSDPLSRK
jgi:hypothetical protein